MSSPTSTTMTGREVDDVRRALEMALCMRITLTRFGVALGLQPNSAKRTIRGWIINGPSGPAATALRLFAIAAPAPVNGGPGWPLAPLATIDCNTLTAGSVTLGERPGDGGAARVFRAMLLEHVRGLLVNQPETRAVENDDDEFAMGR